VCDKLKKYEEGIGLFIKITILNFFIINIDFSYLPFKMKFSIFNNFIKKCKVIVLNTVKNRVKPKINAKGLNNKLVKNMKIIKER
jgi:hypothetical protein